MTTELWKLSASDLQTHYRSKALSPVEVTDAILARIDAVNPDLNAFVTVTDELAHSQAKAAESAYAEGDAPALAGIPISIKDLTWTKGIRTTRGSVLYQD